MGSVSLESVQKLLHIDVPYPQFKSYDQPFEFVVNTVTVKAIAKVSWRRIVIYITEPFEILAWDCQPPLFALGVMMVRRREILARDGKSELDDFIDKTKEAYIRHVTYLRLKPEIDAAQAPILKKLRSELLRLKSIYEAVRSRVAIRKSELRLQFKADLVGQKPYQSELKVLKNEEFEALCAHSTLERKIEMKLEDIKTLLIDQALGNNFDGA